MNIAIDVNDVIRDTYGKAIGIYEKFYIDDDIGNENDNKFEYGLNLPIDSKELITHFKFPNKEDLFDFFYVDFPMEIFGHAPSVSNDVFDTLNKLYEELREKHKVTIICEGIMKTKPATLFFLSKYGCLVEHISFYSSHTVDDIVNEYDYIITANPNLLEKEKGMVKINKLYNKENKIENSFNSLKEFKESEIYKKLK